MPTEIEGAIPPQKIKAQQDIEAMDFFEVPENRALLLKREGHKCFYTLKNLDAQNFVVEHVVSRPHGNNSYRNCVAASREANNRKGSSSAESFMRQLFRDGYLDEKEFKERLEALDKLKVGDLKPVMPNG